MTLLEAIKLLDDWAYQTFVLPTLRQVAKEIDEMMKATGQEELDSLDSEVENGN